MHTHPLLLYLPLRTKLQSTLQLRGQIRSHCVISTPMYSVEHGPDCHLAQISLRKGAVDESLKGLAIPKV